VRRLTILLASAAALLLLPAAGAFANGPGVVTVIVEGTGSGEVSSEGGLGFLGEEYEGFWAGEPPIQCHLPSEEGEVCETEVPEEEFEPGFGIIGLEAIPAAGTEFIEWEFEEGGPYFEGTCGASKTCAAIGEGEGSNLESNITVIAYFEEGEGTPSYPLSVKKTGTGAGTVTSEPAGINCGAGCSTEFEEGTEVTLTAGTTGGNELTGWIGCDSEPAEDECVVTMSEAREVTANFDKEAAPEQPLTLNINQGEGTVISDPAGIECIGAAVETCEAEFEEGAEVTLTASPAAGYRFENWQNCAGGLNGRQCTVTMSEAKEVGVKFRETYDLTIVKAGSGLGSIYNNKNGLTCTLRCGTVSIPFPNVSVTLTGEAPNKEFYFKEFTGGTGSAAACDGETECTLTPEEDSTVEAVFEDRPTATLSIDKAGGGTAKIWGLLWCSENCTSTSGEFFSGEPTPKEVVVNWDLAPGTSSIEWTTGAGTCTGKSEADTGNCTVTMSAAKELVATLE